MDTAQVHDKVSQRPTWTRRNQCVEFGIPNDVAESLGVRPQ